MSPKDKAKIKDHVKRHSKELGIPDSKYESVGVEFLSEPLNRNMEEMTLSNGKRYRYDYKRNWFAVANADERMSTFFAPDDGYEFWENKIKQEGIEI